jgi:hypothetical protein
MSPPDLNSLDPFRHRKAQRNLEFCGVRDSNGLEVQPWAVVRISMEPGESNRGA